MTQSRIKISLTTDERAALEALAKVKYPDMKKGALAQLMRDWLYSEAEKVTIEIQQKTEYGGNRHKTD